MERKKRTVISIHEQQPQFDFDEAAHCPSFTFPEYQRDIIALRLAAGITDFLIAGLVYLVFVAVTYAQMPPGATLLDKRVAGIYGAGYLLLLATYFLLFMISASQTPGMKLRRLIVVSRYDEPLRPRDSCMRGLGYLISILPMMLGFIWILIDPEHLSWADKVSGTFVRKL